MLNKSTRPRSESRQMTDLLVLRLTPDQSVELREHASDAGLRRSSYARAKLFSGTPIPYARLPLIDRDMLAQCLPWLGRVAGSLYQISSALNFGKIYDMRDDLKKALDQVTELRNAILAALGRTK